MAHSRTFTYRELAIRVDCRDAPHLIWLEEFLTPSFGVTAAPTADCTVTLELDDGAYDEALRWGPHLSQSPVACFIFDRQTIRLPVWAAPPATRAVFDDALEVFYFTAAGGREVRILSSARNWHARLALLRAVRELAMRAAWTDHSLVLHAAAVALDGGDGLLIAGPKNTGKTSLMLYCLKAAGARFVSNDRVVVDVDTSHPVAHGLPTVVSIRPQTVTLFKQLHESLLHHPYDDRSTLREVALGRQPTYGPHNGHPASLTPAQLCAFLNVEMVGQTLPRALLFPRVSSTRDGIHVEPLAKDAAAVRLADALFATGSPERTSTFFRWPAAPSVPAAATIERLWLRLVERIPAFDCLLGPQAYRGESGPTLLGRVLADLRPPPVDSAE